jgi:molybdopterin molybdotransferase
VCMVEHTRPDDGGLGVLIEEPVRPGTNVREPGEDIAAGTEVFARGAQLTPAHIGVLASLGIQALLVCPRPVVGVLSTGDELVAPGGALTPGKIRDANRPALLAQLESDGFRRVDLGTEGDDQDILADRLRAGTSRCDAIIATGGVSVGDHDVLKVALEKLGGATMRALEVAIKPGKHFAVASLGEQGIPAFGLPGNPVAALVTYEMFVRPALRAMAGCRVLDRPRISAIAETDLPRRPGPKLHLMRVSARTGADGVLRVRSSGGQESHMLMAMARANALALLPDGDGVRAGRPVEVLLLGTDGF